METVNVVFEGINCKLYVEGVEVTENGMYEVSDLYDWTWKLVADSGYDFSSASTSVEYAGGESWTIGNDESGWKLEYTEYGLQGDYGDSLSVTNAIPVKKGTTPEPDPEPEISFFEVDVMGEFNNVTVLINDVELDLVSGLKTKIPFIDLDWETIIDFKIIADEGYYFKDDFSFVINGVYFSSKDEGWVDLWNEDMTIYHNENIEIFARDGYDIIDGFSSTIKPTSTDNFFHTENVVETNFIYNDTGLVDGDSIAIDGTLIKIIINANDGYEFDSMIEFTDNDGKQYILLEDEGWNEDKTQFTWDYTINGSLTINSAIAKLKEVPVEIVNKFTNIYSPSNLELTELSNSRYEMFNFANGGYEQHDYGSYISALYILPFDIINLIDVRKQSVWLGGKEITSVKSSLVKTNKVVVDMGWIDVPEKYGNTYDYVNTDCYVNLPFTTKVQLETSLVVGSRIGVEYVVDLYTGNATVNVRSEKTNTVIYSDNFAIGYEIPFFQQKADIVNGTIGKRVFNDVTEPFVEVIRNIPYGIEGSYGRPMNEYGVVGSYSGYVEVSKVDLGSACTNIEKDSIERLLSQGIIIR